MSNTTNSTGIVKPMKPIKDLKPDYSKSMDVRGAPIEVCPCGSELWNVKCVFGQGKIMFYFLDMECAACGTLATAPTEIDWCE